jgi:hypothetical protein
MFFVIFVCSLKKYFETQHYDYLWDLLILNLEMFKIFVTLSIKNITLDFILVKLSQIFIRFIEIITPSILNYKYF